MLFNSIDFGVFLSIVFVLYWFVTKHSLKHQNILLIIASYVFYGWWDYRFLFLIALSSILDYGIGIRLKNTINQNKRKTWLWLSIAVNVGCLGFFKYYNFFVENFVQAFSFFGSKLNPATINIILPVGISFYTFQTLSYTVDVYKRKLEATNNIWSFLAYVSFFPQLVAGPIERATNLLPQFYKKRVFSYHKAVDGCRQILWGFFKKMVIADNCAEYANLIFNNSDSYSGSTLVIGAIFFSFQIYGDFSGYSDIAIGVSKLFGFNLMQNFAYPYFSRDVAEFWRRWHISLSTWFRDYVYIPLGGSRGKTITSIRNIILVFLISGFWHGANWTFIAWGLLNALYFIPIFLTSRHRQNLNVVAQNKLMPSLKELLSMLLTFSLTLIAWVFFRADSLTHAMRYIAHMFTSTIFKLPAVRPVYLLLLLIMFILIEWFGRKNKYAIEYFLCTKPKLLRWCMYIGIVLSVFIFRGKAQEFIYFQF